MPLHSGSRPFLSALAESSDPFKRRLMFLWLRPLQKLSHRNWTFPALKLDTPIEYAVSSGAKRRTCSLGGPALANRTCTRF